MFNLKERIQDTNTVYVLLVKIQPASMRQSALTSKNFGTHYNITARRSTPVSQHFQACGLNII